VLSFARFQANFRVIGLPYLINLETTS